MIISKFWHRERKGRSENGPSGIRSSLCSVEEAAGRGAGVVPDVVNTRKLEPALVRSMVRFRNAVARTLRTVNLYDVDLLVGHDVPTLEALVWVSRRLNAPAWFDCVETPRLLDRSGDAFRLLPQDEVDSAQQFVEEKIAAVDGMLTVGPAIAEFLRREYKQPVLVVRNFRSTEERGRGRWIELKRAKEKEGKVLIANPTMFQPSFSPEVTLEALAMLPPEFEMIHFGELRSRHGSRALEIAHKLGVASRIEFFGRVDYERYPMFLGVCDIGLSWLPMNHANMRMAFPNRLADFLAAELPIASSLTPDVADFVNEHDIGVVAQTDDASGMAEAIGCIGSDLGRFRSILHELRKEFCWEFEMSQLMDHLPEGGRVMILTQKDPEYQARTEKMARFFSARGIQVFYISSRFKEVDAPAVQCLTAG